MSYEKFKPTVWSQQIMSQLPKFTVFKQDCDFSYEGEAAQGKKVKVLGIAKPTIRTYVPGQDIAAPEFPSDSETFLEINRFDYFNYAVDNVDRAQAVEGLMEALSEEATRALAEREDSYIASLATGATHITQPVTIQNGEQAKTEIDKLFVTLWNLGVSEKDNLVLYLPPWLYDLFQNRLVELRSDNQSTVDRGLVGFYRGAKVKMSNNIYTDDDNYYVMLKTGKAIAYLNGIDKLEAYQPERRFSDAVKGLNTYGGKIIRQNEIAVLVCNQG